MNEAFWFSSARLTEKCQGDALRVLEILEMLSRSGIACDGIDSLDSSSPRCDLLVALLIHVLLSSTFLSTLDTTTARSWNLSYL